MRQFFDRYLPPVPNAAAMTGASSLNPGELNLEWFVGTCRDLEYPRHTIAKLTVPFEHIRVRTTQNGSKIEAPSLFCRQPHPDSVAGQTI